MIIKQVTIENFRCFYGEKNIDFGKGLNLFIGDNGSGKTTFIEAFEWLFNTSVSNKSPHLISQKKLAELLPSETGTVKVKMKFDHHGEKIVEKSFKFEKNEDEVTTFDLVYRGFEDGEYDRVPTSGSNLLDRCFDAAIRKYSLFKGESELNVFNKPEATQYLIETFSNINDFEPYLSFTEYASKEAQRTFHRTINADKRNTVKAKRLTADIEFHEKEFEKTKEQLAIQKQQSSKYASFLNEFDRSKDASEVLNNINNRIKSLQENQATTSNRIVENYAIKLLDEQWILCGFSTILKEFNVKISEHSKSKRKIEQDERINQGKRLAFDEISAKLANKVLPLDVTIPDKETMQELLNDEICKVCGRPAPKGSEPYQFMQRKIEELKKSEDSITEDVDQDIFANNFMREFERIKNRLSDDLRKIKSLNKTIEEDVAFNNRMKKNEKELKEAISVEEEKKLKLLSQHSSLSEDELNNIFHNLKGWFSNKEHAEKQIPVLQIKLNNIQAKLNELADEYSKLATGDSIANIYSQINTAFTKIKNSFVSAKDKNTRNFLEQLEIKSNEYLERLNTEGYRGIIRIEETFNGGAEIKLCDKHGDQVHYPNTALGTTMYMSVLFAISELTALKRENDYPLIFDAPTSSFSDAKEIDFFNVIADVDKQTIIFTKSFLKADEANEKNILDIDKIDKVKGKIHRIIKKEPFDQKDLSTIEILITEI